ncbi:DUF6194 family protein [Actinomadura gamaensis]|uniref:DUF6194 family protein n=1 Tax=Actinomadura gamaensis TaxID=1763541 RepID=A0ABV9TX41_9ACTN
MSIDDIIAFVAGLDGVLTLRPGPGDGTPEIAWGDAFFYYSPDGVVPTTTQPFATVVTKNYPGDESSRLDRPGAFRVNIAVGRDEFVRRTGHDPREPAPEGTDLGASDTLIAHPVYASQGWLAVVNPGANTEADVRDLLRLAHGLARARYERRARTEARAAADEQC